MDFFAVSMLVVITVSILVGLFSYKRIRKYNREYHLKEDKYTRLFGIITKEHVMILYIIAIIFNSVMAILFLINL